MIPLQHIPVSSRRTARAGLPGYVPFAAIALWFLLVILSASPATAQTDQLTARDIVPEIEAALDERGMPEGARVRLHDPDARLAAPVTIVHTSYNPRSGRFVLRLDGAPFTLAGLAETKIAYATPDRDIARGDIIAPGDLVISETYAVRDDDVLSNAEDLIGMTARRALAAGDPISPRDVTAPTLIEKGAMVTMRYELGGLKMTHQGVALGDGRKGEIISVQNIDSERTMKGVVSAQNLVLIMPRRARATSL